MLYVCGKENLLLLLSASYFSRCADSLCPCSTDAYRQRSAEGRYVAGSSGSEGGLAPDECSVSEVSASHHSGDECPGMGACLTHGTDGS